VRSRPARTRGFTLAEVTIAATISSFVLAGVLSAFLMIGRSGFLASSYSELESEIRRGLATFGDDARKAVDIRWNSDQSITLAVATATNATTLVTYAYDTATAGPTAGCFYRMLGDAASTQPRRVLIHRVAPTFAFQRFKLEQPGVTDNSAHTDLETKLLQVTLRASRTNVATVAANQSAISARYILRNKRVAN
jgi:type II secretory pathway component PulJ